MQDTTMSFPDVCVPEIDDYDGNVKERRRRYAANLCAFYLNFGFKYSSLFQIALNLLNFSETWHRYGTRPQLYETYKVFKIFLKFKLCSDHLSNMDFGKNMSKI